MSNSFAAPWTVARQAPLSWDFPGKNGGVGYHCALQGVFPTQGSNPSLPHCEQILYCWATRAAPIQLPSNTGLWESKHPCGWKTRITPPISFAPIRDHSKRLMTSGCLSPAMRRGGTCLNSREKIETFSRAYKHGIQIFLFWWSLKSSQLLKQKRVTGFLIGVSQSGHVLGVLSAETEGQAWHQWHKRDFIRGKHPK